MIELQSSDSWHYRRYQRWETWKRRTKTNYQPRTTLDLCHYVRVVLIFYSLRWPFQRHYWSWFVPAMVIPIGFVAGTLALIVYALTQVHDWLAVGEWVGAVALGVLLAAAMAFVAYFLFAEKHLHKTVAGTESFQLGKTWVKAKKRRVCPLIQRPS